MSYGWALGGPPVDMKMGLSCVTRTEHSLAVTRCLRWLPKRAFLPMSNRTPEKISDWGCRIRLLVDPASVRREGRAQVYGNRRSVLRPQANSGQRRSVMRGNLVRLSVLPYGRVGSGVQILGTGLTGATAVTSNGIPATTFNVASDTFMEAIVPPGATTGPVQVTTPGGTSTSNVNLQIQL